MDKLKKISLFLSLILFIGCSSEDKNWYPFPNSFFGQTYTAGPIALTSNLNERNIWQNINELNTSLARMSYVMQLGVPEVNIAWFLQDGAWPDEPNFQFRRLNSNYQESEISKHINLNGYTYDRISEKNLLPSNISGNKLNIGNGLTLKIKLNDFGFLKDVSYTGINIAVDSAEFVKIGSARNNVQKIFETFFPTLQA